MFGEKMTSRVSPLVQLSPTGKQPVATTVTLVLSGLLNGFLIYVFCCVFSIVIFHDIREGDTLKAFVPVGISMHAFSVIAGTICFGKFSSCQATIAGPDIQAALFLALIVETIQLGPDPADSPPLEVILPTSLFAICSSTILLGIMFFCVGHCRFTRIVQYLPASLLNGFLACIGSKVLYTALWTACGEYYLEPGSFMFWKLILPAVPLGFGLYFIMAYRIGRPIVSMSILLFLPLVIFYASMYGSGVSMAQARCTDNSESCTESGWFFPEFERETRFYDVFESLQFDKVDFSLWIYSFKDVPGMFIVLVIDFLLKLSSMKTISGREFPFDTEMMTAGLACCVSGILGISVPTYSQRKFTLLNVEITHDTSSRVPSIVCGIFNGVLFFWGFPLVNYIPRFFLGGLLIYMALGFIADSLIHSRNRVSKEEYCAIWLILLVNILVGLLAAVVVGVVCSAIIFALSYGRVGVVKAYIEGCDYESKVVRSVTESTKLIHLSQRYSIIQMQNFIFFGSAGQFLDLAKSLLAQQAGLPKARRLAYVIFDWTNVYGIDYSGVGVFSDIVNMLKEESIMVVFTGVQDKIMQKLVRENILQDIAGVYDTMDFGVEWVEEQLLEWAHLVRSRWLEFKPVVKMHELAKNKAKHDALEEILHGIGFSHELWRYITRLGLGKGEVLCTPGELVRTMYIVQQGKFSSYFTDEMGNVRKVCSYTRGAYINECALFTTVDQLYKIVADVPNTIVLAITHTALAKLKANQPDILIGLQATVLNFYRQSNMKLEREIGDLEHTRMKEMRYQELRRSPKEESRGGERRGSIIGNALKFLKPASNDKLFTSAFRNSTESLIDRSSSNGSIISWKASASHGSLTMDSAASRLGHGKGSKSTRELMKNHESTDPGVCLLHAIVKLSRHENKRKLHDLLGNQSMETGVLQKSVNSLDIAHDNPDAVSLFHYTKEDTCKAIGLTRRHTRTKSLRNLLEDESLEVEEVDGLLRMSRKQELDCRACFKTHDKANLGYITSTVLADVLEDMGHFISKKEISLLLRNKQSYGKPNQQQNSLAARNSRVALSMLMKQSAESCRHSRRIDPSDISRESQQELISIFLSSSRFFTELEHHSSGLIHSVMQQSELLVFHQDEAICLEKAPVNSLFVIVDGTVSCERNKETTFITTDQAPLVFGETQVFLPSEMRGSHSYSVTVASSRAIVIEVHRSVLCRIVPEHNLKRKQLQEKALFQAQHNHIAPQRRVLYSVFSEQQKAPFGARFRALSNIDLFKELLTSDKFLLSRVASESEVVEFRKHDFVFVEGDSGDSLFVVLCGDVRVKTGSETYTMLLSKSRYGYTLGEQALFEENHVRESNVMVISESLVALKMSRQSLGNIFEASHSIWDKIRTLGRQIGLKRYGAGFGKVGGRLVNFGTQLKLTLTPLQNSSKVAPEEEEKTEDQLEPTSGGSEESAFGDQPETPRLPSIILPNDETSHAGSLFSSERISSVKKPSLLLPEDKASIQHQDGVIEILRVTEEDVLNMVNQLTFYPLLHDHLEVIQEIYSAYKQHDKLDSDIAHMASQEEANCGILPVGRLVRLFSDGNVNVTPEAVQNLLSEWRTQDYSVKEPYLTFSAFVSIIAAAIKREQLHWEVENTFTSIVSTDPIMVEQMNDHAIVSGNLSTTEKWEELALKGVGIYWWHIQSAYRRLLDIHIEQDACEEMIFENDRGGFGFLPYNDWLESIVSIHHCELESTEFERFESAVQEREVNAETDTKLSHLIPDTLKSFRVSNFTKRISSKTFSRANTSSFKAAKKPMSGAELFVKVGPMNRGIDNSDSSIDSNSYHRGGFSEQAAFLAFRRDKSV